MAKKRKPGGGRKLKPNKKVMFSTRLEPHVMAALKAAAEKWPSGNVSEFTERLIADGLRRRDEAAGDPALRGLLFMIAQLAENLGGGAYTPDKELRSILQKEWRTDLFAFRAFKFAVAKLLDAIEEPPDDLTEEDRIKLATEAAAKEFGDSPEFTKLFLDTHKSPEALGAFTFANLWTRAGRTNPISERERELVRQYPYLAGAIDGDVYDLPKARKALELKPKDEAQ